MTCTRGTLVPTALAAVVRLAHFAFLARRDPLFGVPIVDTREHLAQAADILQKGLLLPGTPAFFKGPLYSYLLAVVLWILPDVSQVTMAAQLISLVAGVATVWLVARTAELLGGSRAAWLAGLAAALQGTAVYFDATALVTPLVCLLLLGSAYAMVRGSTGHEPAGRYLLAAGVLAGLAAITRANALLCIAAAAVYLFILTRRQGVPGLRPSRALLCFLGGAAIAVAPVTARNVLVAGDPVLVSYNGGVNLYLGNDPAFDQGSGNWHSASTWSRISSAPGRLGYRRGADQQRFFVSQALDRAADEPVAQAYVLGHKLALLFTGYEIPNNRRIEPVRQFSPVLGLLMAGAGPFRLPLSLLLPLLTVGVYLSAAGRVPRRGVLLVLAAACAVTPVLFFPTARYRLPAVLLLLPVAASGWAWATREPVQLRRRWPWVAGIGGVALALTALTVPENPGLPPSDEIWLAEEQARLGRLEDAVAFSRSAVQSHPDDPMVRERAANGLSECGLWREAWGDYQELYRLSETRGTEWAITALHGVARCLVAEGRYEAALGAYRRVLELEPDAPMERGRRAFVLRGVPPFAACETRLPMALLLVRLERPAEALAQLDWIMARCVRDMDLLRRASALRAALVQRLQEEQRP